MYTASASNLTHHSAVNTCEYTGVNLKSFFFSKRTKQVVGKQNWYGQLHSIDAELTYINIKMCSYVKVQHHKAILVPSHRFVFFVLYSIRVRLDWKMETKKNRFFFLVCFFLYVVHWYCCLVYTLLCIHSSIHWKSRMYRLFHLWKFHMWMYIFFSYFPFDADIHNAKSKRIRLSGSYVCSRFQKYIHVCSCHRHRAFVGNKQQQHHIDGHKSLYKANILKFIHKTNCTVGSCFSSSQNVISSRCGIFCAPHLSNQHKKKSNNFQTDIRRKKKIYSITYKKILSS